VALAGSNSGPDSKNKQTNKKTLKDTEGGIKCTTITKKNLWSTRLKHSFTKEMTLT
jgi:hypothetical protein